jgi:DNA-binding transcriptional ArsR family regulator
MIESVRRTTTPDLWRRGGLGPKAGAIYAALPRSVDDLSRLLGIRERTVRRYLKLLKSHGLALKGEDAVWRQGPADLDVVAMTIGAAGLGPAQRKEHERQRERFDDLVDRGGHRGRKERA